MMKYKLNKFKSAVKYTDNERKTNNMITSGLVMDLKKREELEEGIKQF